MSKKITEIEKAAIYYGILNNIPQIDIYLLCHPGRNRATDASPAAAWRRSDRIRPYYDSIEALRKQQDEEKKQLKSKTEKATTTAAGVAEAVDFTNRDEFIKYLNTAANSTKDDKQKADYLKMLADLQQFKKDEAGKDGPEIMRFYTPLICHNCPLYRSQAEALQGPK